MGLTLPLGLLLVLGVGVVIFAHSLRKGRAAPIIFPGTRLVLENTATAKKRQRISNPWLLLLRTLLVLSLALLAASPFVSCSRLTLSRNRGASVSAVIVVDDSASMQASQNGETRLSRAIRAAHELLNDARSGDTFALVLAGSKARIAVSSTTDVPSLREALQNIEMSDRGTDLQAALELARSLQTQSTQTDQPIVLLSDLSISDQIGLDLTSVTIPEIALTQPLSNCAVINAAMNERSVTGEIVCTSAQAIESRRLELVVPAGTIQASVPAHDGIVSVPLSKSAKEQSKSNLLRLRLSPSKVDQITSDDEAYILQAPSKLTVAVRADQARAGVKTSSDTVLQSGLEALDRALRVEPLSLLPDEEAELSQYAALLIDDPSGFSPESRKAIGNWVSRGGVAAVFLGPGMSKAQLGSNFEPFLKNAPNWSSQTTAGVPPDRAGALGPLTVTWNDLNSSGRALINLETDHHILAAWSDGLPLIAERTLGQGLLLISTLPSSVAISDFVLRPAYLELLDHVVAQANLRLGSASTPVGQPWRVAAASIVVDQKGRRLPIHAIVEDPNRSDKQIGSSANNWIVTPDRAGAYQLSSRGNNSRRFATRIAQEQITQPNSLSLESAPTTRATGHADVEISREVALAALVFTVLELLARLFRPQSARGMQPILRQNKTSTKVLA